MKVLIAIDSFKGSLSSVEGSRAISLGIRDVYEDAEIFTFPLADGGEGTVEALVASTAGQYITKEVTGPLNGQIEAVYGIVGDGNTAVIEVASACGLPLIPSVQRNPLVTTTYGVGELILDAMDRGCREFIIGLGGSATNDAGVGMLQALGYRFLNEDNKEVGLGGRELQYIHSIDDSKIHPELKNCTFKVACDVNNPLHGPNGAAYIFGPQKGATAEDVQELDKGLRDFAEVVLREVGRDIQTIPGAGAAGGLGAAFTGFLQGQLQSGIQLILNEIKMEENLLGVDFVITGEGKLDRQTSMGKVPLGVAQIAKRYNVPTIALAGGVEEEAYSLNEHGITACFPIINEPMSLQQAMDSQATFNNLRATTTQLFRLFRAVGKE